MHTLPTLPYGYNALEPYIDAKTMEIHHTKHHQAYIDKLNAALEKYPNLQSQSAEDLLTDFANLPQDLKTAVKNHAGGHVNHSLFWTSMAAPGGKPVPDGALSTAITTVFGSFDKFKEDFTAQAAGHFGSGWAWLCQDKDGLHLETTPNQDSPLMAGHTPILGLDVWEHAYYLNYQNRRGDYITAWWNVINWSEVEKRYDAHI